MTRRLSKSHFSPPQLSVALKRGVSRPLPAGDSEMLKNLQLKILRIQQGLFFSRKRAIILFEGFDASGKGGAIRRLTSMLDPRSYRVHPIGAPDPTEQGKHWLYRFWKKLPAPGEIAIFDRSWYGRVLVERVDGLTPAKEWRRSFEEIRQFEEMLFNDGIDVVKIYLAISKEEQLSRFEERLSNPYKQWKIQSSDIEARKKWKFYVEAADELLKKTHTRDNPWHLIAADNKVSARIEVLATVDSRLKEHRHWMELLAKGGQSKQIHHLKKEIKKLIIAIAICVGFCAQLGLPPAFAENAPISHASLVDLHSHFFMPEATGLERLGNFEGKLQARTWEDRLKTRVNAEALERSQVKIAVVALYTHPLFLGSQRNQLRRQLNTLNKFVELHPSWIIAKNPAQAKAALGAGKRVIVLSLEGANGTLETDADFQEFIEQAGIRIVTPLHFVDDWIGGAALMPDFKIWVNPKAALRSYLSPKFDSTGVRINSQGITPEGAQYIRKLLRAGVWIDLSHASDASAGDMIPWIREAHQPLLYTHTVLRSGFHGERGITPELLQIVKETYGIVGLLPSDDELEGTTQLAACCPTACHAECEGGVAAFCSQFVEMTRKLPATSILIGSDMDAPLTFLKPSCPEIEKSNPRGIWEYGQLPVLAKFLELKGLTPPETPSINPLDDFRVKAFLAAWDLATQSTVVK